MSAGAAEPLDPVPPRFWMTTLPLSVQLIWHVANTHGRAKYLAMKALHRHPWQSDPAYGRDLPDDVPANAAEPHGAAPLQSAGESQHLASPR